MAEAFLSTLGRDYIIGADLSSVSSVLDQVPTWLADYTGVAPHLALGFRSPQQYRAKILQVR